MSGLKDLTFPFAIVDMSLIYHLELLVDRNNNNDNTENNINDFISIALLHARNVELR